MEEAKTEPVVEKTAPEAETAAAPAKDKLAIVVDKKKIMIGAVAAAVIVLGYIAWMKLQPVLVAARVNGKTITRLQVIHELEKQGGASVLDGLISDQLLEDKAAAQNITISASDVQGEVNDLKTQLAAQGQTLDSYLASQNITQDYLANRLRLRLMLQRLLADKTAVTDAEVDDYIKQNAATFPKGTDTKSPAFREQVRSQLSAQKFSDAATPYMTGLKSAADIQYVHKY